MKIKILYTFDIIFGYAAIAWSEYFNSHGHEAIHVNVQADSPDPYRQSWQADINLFIGCRSLLRMIANIGYPQQGKHILWMLDPLTHESACHAEKMQAWESIDNRFDAIACMDARIKNYFEQHYPLLLLVEIPYALTASRIIKPMDENHKIIDILMLGSRTFRRDKVVSHVRAAGLNMTYMHSGCWGEKRKKLLHNTKISLQLLMDDYLYFDQFRVFEACAHGALVVGPAMPDMQKYGFVHGHNIIQCDAQDIPCVCADLLFNDNYRHQLIDNAQANIRERFTTQALGKDMLALCANVL